jgi:predicted dehydrogenase
MAGGDCLRNVGSHGLDMFLHLTGEPAQVTGAQLSRRAHDCRVEVSCASRCRTAANSCELSGACVGDIDHRHPAPRCQAYSCA